MASAHRPQFGYRPGDAPPPRRRTLALALAVSVILALVAAGPAVASTPTDAATQVTSATAPGAPGAADNSALRQKIVSIALSQIGNADNPVATSFRGLNCNPYTTMVAGFSANSNGCGNDSRFNVRNSNENWCSDFVKWVWQQAGVTQEMNTINAAASSFYQWAVNDGQSPQADAGTPQIGDAIVFFGAGPISPTRYADHVGIVSAVNADGTIDMVNGDFLGATNVHVEHDTNLTLSTFAPHTWGAGEQWVIVSPPTVQQPPNPTASITGSGTAVTGTEASFHADASEQGGSVTAYYWTFGDGRTTNATGADVTHVFATPGTHTITVTATSNFGTITTERKNVTVLAASASVAAVPSTATWYSSYPVSYYSFVRSSDGLAANVWDGASWLEIDAAGAPASTGSIAALAYPDADADSATTPHAYFRADSGSLAETSLDGTTWVSKNLPGTPAEGGDVVAAVTASGPAVYFVDAHGHLAETREQSGTWSTRTLTAFPVRSAPLALDQTVNGPKVFAVGPSGVLTATAAASQTATSWLTQPIGVHVTKDATLTAVTTPSGRASVIVNGTSGAANGLVALTERERGKWATTSLPADAAPGTAVTATDYLMPGAVSGALGAFEQPPGSLDRSGPAHPLGTVIAYLGSGGAPAVAYDDGTGWHSATLPGSATAVTGISAFPVAHQPIQVYLQTAVGPAMDTTGDTAPPTGPWTTQALPSAPAGFADRVMLYAAGSGDAGSGDASAADAAASVAGLPASQVTTSFDVAWAAALSGDYLVITVGQAATNALEYNVCGWPNPSAVDPGSTPFDYVTAPRTTLPGAELFVNGAAATASQGQERATDLAYYAVHGALPSGETTVPPAARASRTCLGSAS